MKGTYYIILSCTWSAVNVTMFGRNTQVEKDLEVQAGLSRTTVEVSTPRHHSNDVAGLGAAATRIPSEERRHLITLSSRRLFLMRATIGKYLRAGQASSDDRC
jgi:hypothetical protein